MEWGIHLLRQQQRLHTTSRRAQSHNNIIFNKKHIMCLIFCN
jgi:hypothetical protein